MVSTTATRSARLPPAQRRAQILSEAADIALSEGLERVTLRAVADRLEVRHGLITHYFPAAEELVVEAFTAAAGEERELLFPSQGSPLSRMRHLVEMAESPASAPLARLWLNARHLSRFTPALAIALEEQEEIDRDRMVALVQSGIASGDFHPADAAAAAVRILIAIDGVGVYANSPAAFADDAYLHFVADTAEWALGLAPATLRSA